MVVARAEQRARVRRQKPVPQAERLGLALELDEDRRPRPLVGVPSLRAALLGVQPLVRVDVLLHELPQPLLQVGEVRFGHGHLSFVRESRATVSFVALPDGFTA
jgi:hypothetical protein